MRKIIGGIILAGCVASIPLPAAAAPSPFPSALTCARCHEDIYDSWSRTFHSFAAIDPAYREALKRARKTKGEEAAALCMMCHSPTTILTGDFTLDEPLAREGVTCAFCHSVTDLHLEKKTGRFTNTPELLIDIPGQGKITDHHFENHNITMTSSFCAGCHEWTNSYGLNVLSTYSEWEASPYAGEKVSCQQCHMPTIFGNETMSAGSKTIRSTNLHFQLGGHSQDLLVAAAKMTVTAEVKGKQVIVNASIENLKAGHKVPTGIPSRKMKLIVDLFDGSGQVVDSAERVYSRVIADSEGNILEDVTDQFLSGAQEISDTRIEPKGTRHEQFNFLIPPDQEFLLVEASLVYEIVTPHLTPKILSFDVDEKRIPLSLREKSASSSSLPSLIIITIVFLGVTAAMILIFKRSAGKV